MGAYRASKLVFRIQFILLSLTIITFDAFHVNAESVKISEDPIPFAAEQPLFDGPNQSAAASDTQLAPAQQISQNDEVELKTLQNALHQTETEILTFKKKAESLSARIFELQLKLKEKNQVSEKSLNATGSVVSNPTPVTSTSVVASPATSSLNAEQKAVTPSAAIEQPKPQVQKILPKDQLAAGLDENELDDGVDSSDDEVLEVIKDPPTKLSQPGVSSTPKMERSAESQATQRRYPFVGK